VPVPATVVIVPPGETRRTRRLSASAIRNPPSAVTAIPNGELSWAAVAAPPSPEKPGVPVPATVKMLFVAAPAAGATVSAINAAVAPSTSSLPLRNARITGFTVPSPC
jgi:hypothetical protein